MESPEFFQPTVLTVTALSSYLRELLETDEVLRDVWVRGEISNFSQPRSGHLYFTLKDAEAQIRCVMWKTSAFRLKFAPRDGQSVEVHGSMSLYPAGGQVQLYIDSMQPVGEGLLYQEFLRLKNKLELEGLFDPAHKKPIPDLPRHIGIISSATGAALQDMLNTIRRRMPLARVTIAPSQVQGTEAPGGLIDALQRINQIEDLDLILLARGGGSIEDLWAFNDENLARAIFRSRKPVITGVGHETDFTIADFVADLRAPTPTAAAELATSVTINDLALTLRHLRRELDDGIENAIETRANMLELRGYDLRRLSPLQRVNNAIQTTDLLRERLDRGMDNYLNQARLRLSGITDRLEAISPTAVLKRGFVIVSDCRTGRIVRKASQTHHNQTVDLRFIDGKITALLQSNPKESQ